MQMQIFYLKINIHLRKSTKSVVIDQKKYIN